MNLSHIANPPVPVADDDPVTGVIVEDDGRVVGVHAETPQGEVAARARQAVFFCSGGFTHNEEMRRDHLGGRVVGGCAALTNEGDFHQIALRLGIPLVHMDAAYMAPSCSRRCLPVIPR
jgi:3-oxosteroid 1-dehydrogenase